MTSASTKMKGNDIWFDTSCKTQFQWVCTVNVYQIFISQSRTKPPDVILKLFPMESMATYAIKILLRRFQGYKEWQHLSYNSVHSYTYNLSQHCCQDSHHRSLLYEICFTGALTSWNLLHWYFCMDISVSITKILFSFLRHSKLVG